MDGINIEVVRIRGRIAEERVRKSDLAEVLGYELSRFSRILSGERPAPPDFEAQVYAAIDRVKRAHSEAQAAYDRVLAEAPTEAAHE